MLHVPPPTNQPVLQQTTGQCCRFRKVVAESRIVVLLLATKSLYYVARFTYPRQTCIVASDEDPVYGVTPRNCIQSEASIHKTCN